MATKTSHEHEELLTVEDRDYVGGRAAALNWPVLEPRQSDLNVNPVWAYREHQRKSPQWCWCDDRGSGQKSWTTGLLRRVVQAQSRNCERNREHG